MTRRWTWDFEDEPPASRSSPSIKTPLEGRDNAALARFRRRRSAAALGLLLAIVLIAVALGGSHHGASGSGGGVPSAATRSRLAERTRPTETEADANEAVRRVLSYTPFVREGAARARDIAL